MNKIEEVRAEVVFLKGLICELSSGLSSIEDSLSGEQRDRIRSLIRKADAHADSGRVSLAPPAAELGIIPS